MSIVFILLLLIAAYIDIKKREIPDTVCVYIGVISLFDLHPFGILSALPFLICAMMNPNDIGGGDIKLTASVGLFLGFWDTLYGLIIALSITTIIHVTHKLYIKIKRQEVQRKAVPLAPFLTIGFLTTHFIF